jgi:hypothetical protein
VTAVSAAKGNQKPYRPFFIHAFYNWLDRLPIPDWFFLVLLFPAVGIAQHLVAWSRGMLSPGEFSYDLGTAAIYLTPTLLLGVYVLKGAPRALDEYRPLLDVTEEEFADLKYRFVTIPSGLGALFFLMGGAMGVVSGFSDMAVAQAVDYAFPQMRIGIWVMGSAMTTLFGYQVARQLRQIGAFYAMPDRIDPFNQRPLYGFSRYTATLGALAFIVLLLSLADPTAFAAYSSTALIAYFSFLIGLTLLMFYLPLSGAHRRLVSDKDRLLQQVNSHIATIVARIHSAAFEQQNYQDVGGLRTVLSALREEEETIQDLSTWPWRPGTFTGLLSALFLPVVLLLIREVITRLLGS